MLKSRSISVILKIKMYMTWALRKAEEVRLVTFERKVLRQINGSYLDPRTR